MHRFQNRPFTLLGVNADAQPETTHKLQAQGAVVWRSWFDGGEGGGRIASAWGVDLYPTVILIDHKGVVRAMHVGTPGERTLEKELEALVHEAESGS